MGNSAGRGKDFRQTRLSQDLASILTIDMYLTPQEKAVVDAAEEMMTDSMARYDPSHDKYHGKPSSADTQPVFT